MAKKQTEKYIPTDEEFKAMYLCNKNDLAYVIQALPHNTKYCIVKFEISDSLAYFTLKEKDVIIEFSEYDASKKVMELYTQHSKRFKQ